MELIERTPVLCKQGVTGSIPVTSTNLFNPFVAISAEHLLPQQVFLLLVVSLLPPKQEC